MCAIAAEPLLQAAMLALLSSFGAPRWLIDPLQRSRIFTELVCRTAWPYDQFTAAIRANTE